MALLRACVLLFLWLLPAAAFAHATATGLGIATVDGTTIDYRLTLHLMELPERPAQRIYDGAVGDSAAAAEATLWLQRNTVFAVEGAACAPGPARLQYAPANDARVFLAMTLRCDRAPGRLTIRDGWDSLFGPHYRAIVNVRSKDGEAAGEVILQEDRREATVDLGVPTLPFAGYLMLGVEHILGGIDHLFFLAALLLAARGLWSVLGTVTAFTLAHSVTLSLAALGLADLPAAVIEPLIAASIVWVAAENLYGAEGAARRVAVTFLFGLVHGLGFAEVLRALDLEGWRMVVGLAGFNLGVEAGQAAVVLVIAPLLLWARGRRWGLRFRHAASIGLVLIGAFWLVERIIGASA